MVNLVDTLMMLTSNLSLLRALLERFKEDPSEEAFMAIQDLIFELEQVMELSGPAFEEMASTRGSDSLDKLKVLVSKLQKISFPK